MPEGINLLSDLCEALLPIPNRSAEIRNPKSEILSYRDAFLRHAGVDPLTADVAQLRQVTSAAGAAVPPGLDNDRDGWLDLLLSEVVGSQLGRERPVILYDFPASQAALAVVRDEDPPVAERF